MTFIFEFEPVSWAALQTDFDEAGESYPEVWKEVTPDWTEEVRDALESEPYPSQPAGSRYIRTYRLRAGWATEQHGNTFMIVNRVIGARHGKPYARYPVGDSSGYGQRWSYWWLARDIIDEHFSDLVKRHAKAVADNWGDEGGSGLLNRALTGLGRLFGRG